MTVLQTSQIALDLIVSLLREQRDQSFPSIGKTSRLLANRIFHVKSFPG